MFDTKVKNLKYIPYGNAKVYEYENEITLISYTTRIITYKKDTQTFYCGGLYSATTRKHISAFMREYFYPLDYYNIKRVFEKGNYTEKGYNFVRGLCE